MTANGLTTTFTYGPDGDRIKKEQGSTVIRYPFGDDYEIATNGTVTKYFNAGFGPIAKKVGGTLYWLHTDRLGSINATTDGQGVQVLRRSYRSYGELFGQTGSHAESLGYIGQRTDEETKNGTTDDKGLTYLHARYYDSALGIFLSPDPAGTDLNTYRYATNDPVNRLDPSGLDDSDPCEGLAGLCFSQYVDGYNFELGVGGIGTGPGLGFFLNNILSTLFGPTVPLVLTNPNDGGDGGSPSPVATPTPTPTSTPTPTPTPTPTGPAGKPKTHPGSGNEPCRETGTCTAEDLGYRKPPRIPTGAPGQIPFRSGSCPSFGDQFTANQRAFDSEIGSWMAVFMPAKTGYTALHGVGHAVNNPGTRIVTGWLTLETIVIAGPVAEVGVRAAGLATNVFTAAGDYAACTAR